MRRGRCRTGNGPWSSLVQVLEKSAQASAGNRQERFQGFVQGGDQTVDILSRGVRAAQRHVVEWRDEDAAVDQVQVQRHLQAVVEGRFSLCAGLRRAGAELEFAARAQLA